MLATTAVQLSGWQVLVALFPASLYGEGLRRAFRQLIADDEQRFIGWRGRLGLLPLIAVGPGPGAAAAGRRALAWPRCTGRAADPSRSAW